MEFIEMIAGAMVGIVIAEFAIRALMHLRIWPWND